MIKVISLDLDNTITTNNSWEDLNFALGISVEEDQRMYYEFMSGKISYQEWMNELSVLWKKHKVDLSRAELMDLYKPIYRLNLAETIDKLRSQNPGCYIGITSGAPSIAVDRVLRDLHLDFALSTNQVIFDKDNIFQELIDLGDETLSGKPNLLAYFCKNKNILFNECIHVGDSRNDITLFRTTGNGIAFNWCKEDVKKEAVMCIDEIVDLPNAIEQIKHRNLKLYKLLSPYVRLA